MSKLRRALTMLAVVAVLCTPAWAEKVTVDPNAPGAQATASEDNKADPRLLQKITYDSGYKRLHAVVEDINRLSGMAVRCGRNKTDWRVRDIPMAVYVKDMPLGKLLRAIADATHTWFASERVGDNPKKSYRIYRRYKEESAIDAFFERRHKARLAAVDWRWDAMVAYGNSEEIVDVPGVPKTAWLAARLFASLGSDAKNRLLAGETLEFRGSDPAYQSAMHELYRLAWEDLRFPGSESAPSPTVEDMDRAVLNVKLVDEGQTGGTQIDTVVSPLVYGRTFTAYLNVQGAPQQLQGRGLDLPPYPEQVRIPSSEEDMGNPEMVALKTRFEEDMERPLLRAKFDLEKPKDVKEPTFADVVRAVASASGCNIVTEDFTSHKNPEYQRLGYLFKKQTDIYSSLLRMQIADHYHHEDYTWFLNEKDALLVGWANDIGFDFRRWRDHHRHMLPEKYLDDLKAKLGGDGVELDDAVHVMCLPDGSLEEWILNSRDFRYLICHQTHPAWQLYDALEPVDKLAAKSSDGLALGQFDTAWIAGFFHTKKMREPCPCEIVPRSGVDEQQAETRRRRAEEERQLMDRAMSDPDVISTMVMRVENSAATYRWRPDGGARAPDKLDLTKYNMVIYYKMDGEDRSVRIAGPALAFPVWSAEREAEIIKAAGVEDKGRAGL